jgi:hypothetical protein
MIEAFENRRGPDRRRSPRGGRRAGDVQGFAPLVLVVGRGETAVAQSEAVLARLKFAVTTSATVDEALRVLSGIRPDVVVAEPDAASRIRLEAPEHVPVVEMSDDMRGNPDALIDGIRYALRANDITTRP